VSLTITLPGHGIIKFFPVKESLVNDIPAGDRKIDKLFYRVLTMAQLTSEPPTFGYTMTR
jgi:hypothetical protein